ncbi:hypothetical protein [Paenibacillus naphthalenovorans]|uniref:DUF7210 family protein n=1 Tax=Paenibacillus naphthalenovorans TaxID=162209 RepID=UPI003D29E434
MPDEQNSFENLSIDDVVGLIENGEITAEEALEIEKKGKQRKTLIGILEKMLPDPEALGEQRLETVKVVFVANTKHNKTLYRKGEKAKVSPEDYEVLLAAKVIASEEE